MARTGLLQGLWLPARRRPPLRRRGPAGVAAGSVVRREHPADRGRGDQAMKTVDLAKASKSLSAYAHDLGEEPVILTVDDKPVAALVSLKNVDRESLVLS